MTLDFQNIEAPDERERIARAILLQLPEWFGIPESTEEYCTGCRDLDFWAVFDHGVPVGFVSLKIHNAHTAELYVLGLHKAYHRRGIGTQLLGRVEDQCRRQGFRFLEVKTLDSSRESPEYRKTRLFYENYGFSPLETLTEIWGEANPCLIMVKALG